MAPYLLPPGTTELLIHGGKYSVPVKSDRIHIEQECCLVRGHDGPHRSLTNVIKDS
jgi:hypothetical protein